MSRHLTFEELWERINSVNHSFNGLNYHPCCDVWTTRSSKTKRATHKTHLHWRQITALLDKSFEDKKQALLAKMTEEEWRLPALLNEFCQVRPGPIFQQQSAFRLHQPDIQPQDLEADFSPRNYVFEGQVPSELVSASGNQLFTMMLLYQD